VRKELQKRIKLLQGKEKREKHFGSLTHSRTGAIAVHMREAAAVERLLHVLLSGLRFIPSNLQQLVLQV